MPYRTELKRPDLKGTFRCSVCHKIFCHSSSLSRHRMQAHFKSYTCTLCNKEITSNETLRAHMYKQHQISRMFMCRCCNWAFPDKTSLHIHMQAMAATGKPGNVSIIAKSAASPNIPTPTSMSEFQMPHPNPSISPNVPVSMVGQGIFPMLPSREEVLMKIRERVLLNGAAQQAGLHLASWLANFPRVDASGVGSLGGSLNLLNPEESTVDDPIEDDNNNNNEPHIEEMTAEDSPHESYVDIDESEHNETGQSTENGQADESVILGGHTVDSNNVTPESKEDLPVLRSAISSSPLNSLLYRKKLDYVLRRKFNMDNMLLNESHDSGIETSEAPTLKPEETHHINISPSDTHSSSSRSGTVNSPPGPNCFECQVFRGKLALADNRNRFLEGKGSNLQNEIGRLKSKLANIKSGAGHFEGETKTLRNQNEVLQRKLIECQEKTLLFLQNIDNLNPENVQRFLTEVLQTTYLG